MNSHVARTRTDIHYCYLFVDDTCVVARWGELGASIDPRWRGITIGSYGPIFWIQPCLLRFSARDCSKARLVRGSPMASVDSCFPHHNGYSRYRFHVCNGYFEKATKLAHFRKGDFSIDVTRLLRPTCALQSFYRCMAGIHFCRPTHKLGNRVATVGHDFLLLLSPCPT